MVGSKLRVFKRVRPTAPKAVEGEVSAAFIAAMDVWTASGTLLNAAAEFCVRDDMAAAVLE